jgi:hypothetical protein
VVVIGPATSKSFQVVPDAADCDYLIGSGPDAPARASRLGRPLIWDGEGAETSVAVFGAGARGLTLAVAARESDLQLVAVAHPDLEAGGDRTIAYPEPVGIQPSRDEVYGGKRLATAGSPNGFAACLVSGAGRRVAIVDDAAFLSGVALAAGFGVLDEGPVPVWEEALSYLRTAVAMGLVMAEG